MAEVSEFRQHWRPLLGAFIGMGSALSLNSYILSIFAPYLIEDFGWSLSQWARLGMVQMLVMIFIPIAGRLTDIYGVRRVAAVGALSFPVFMIAIAMVHGNTGAYLAIYIAQTVLCSSTTATVYSRVVATAFKVHRGIALGILGSSPPLVGAMLSPLMSGFVASYGWRSGYIAVALFSAVCAILMLALLKPDRPQPVAAATPGAARPVSVYRAIGAMPVFWLLLSATFLVNLPFTLATTQLKTVVLAQGLPDSTAALLVSVFALGSIGGRLVAGFALDHMPANVIAAINYALPTLALLMLISPFDSTAVVTSAMLLLGLSFGGEGDILPYVVTRYFHLGVFSTVLGLLSAATGLAMGMGNGLLSLTGGFNNYMLIAATTAAIGSVMFLISGHAYFQRERLAAEAAAA